MKVLFIDDEEMIRHASCQTLNLAGFNVEGLADAESALPLLQANFPGVIVCDVRLPGIDGLQFLARSVAQDPELPVVLVTGHGDVAMAVQAMRAGAYDFIEKPFSSEQLIEVVRRAIEKRTLVLENRQLRRELQRRSGIEATLLGKGPSIEQLRRRITDLASTDADVLVFGETGTGKELVARCLHRYSDRADKPFVALNCGALPEQLFESEIFGHEAGAFTGAAKRRIGKIEYASGGTLFLDEIESMPLALQVKLLRVLQERELERVGGNEVIPVDCRIVTATKCDLKQLSEQGKFRLDLYYRLNVVTLNLSPLRERCEDIPLLFEHFVLQAALRYHRPAPIVSQGRVRELMLHGWDGNVRELRNVADRFVLGLLDDAPASEVPLDLPALVERFERNLIDDAMQRAGGQVSAASVSLGMPRKTLYDKIKRYGLGRDSE
ncbi:sigma-54-dependent Fis family transcriptional regulator [Jeongeupia sp. HS-3]|uniref:sigma-54-dependent transcriptional regulator n=1 Tax=Jeongeupia sp. HS-3 TaxID=1009682 RepID=UPI0018A68F2C|nr:sigma-54 dependent transcriptional regulator [Jeongeupia sp. HS-3]BCL76280.1 sigma-54-dependent Fis family transcriptional regulator [Jeongeupia sp. HS-3]